MTRHRLPPPDAESTFADPRAAAAFLADLLAQPGISGADLELLGAGRHLRLRLRCQPPRRPPGAPALALAPLSPQALSALLARRAQAAGAPALAAPLGLPAIERELADLFAEADVVAAEIQRLLGRVATEADATTAEGLAWIDPARVNRVLKLRVGLEGLVRG